MNSRFALFCSLIFGLGAQAKVIFVDADRPAAGANGTTWATAFPDLQDALANSVPDDRIFVAEGTYYPGTLRNNFFGLQGGVAIFGGFDGTESDSAERDPVAHRTILSGDIDRNDTPEGGNNAGNSFVVIRGDSLSNPARLDGFTIEGGFNDVVPLESAGLNAENCMFSVSNCIFRRNVSPAGGGGAVRLSFRSQGLTNTPTFTGCIFEDNEARQGGAVIYGNNYFPVFIDCIFRNNTATQNGGGAVSTSGNPDNPGQNVFFTRCLFEGNSATNLSGGALELNFNEAPILRDCIFRGNRANTRGGAAFLAESQTSATFVNTIFWNNADRTNPNAPILAQASMEHSLPTSLVSCNQPSPLMPPRS